MNPITHRYKIPFLIALVVGLGVIALGGISQWYSALFIFAGTILGAFLLDAEYLIQAYFIDPQRPSSISIKETFSGRNIRGIVNYFDQNEYTFGELSIRSAFFQVLMAIFTLYVLTTASWVLMQGLTLSMFANLIYVQLMELNKTGSLKRWFWIYSGPITEKFYSGYIFFMIILLVWLFSFV